MYMRFVTNLRHWESQQKLGVIRAVCWFEGMISQEDLRRLDALYAWFDYNLPVPHRFARSKNRYAEKKAICWFKKSAERFISRAREIAEILETNGITAELWLTKKPGYVVYEDANQVAAIPFRDTLVTTPNHRAPVRFRFARRGSALVSAACSLTFA